MLKSRKRSNKSLRHDPLHKEILESRLARPSSRNKIRNRRFERDGQERTIDNKLTKEILSQARKQQQDLEEETGLICSNSSNSRLSLSEASDTEDDHFPEIEDSDAQESEFLVDEEDEKALQKFLGGDIPEKETLVDVLKEKLTEKQTEIQSCFSDIQSVHSTALDERRTNYFKELAPALKVYRSGKFPKSFKAIPRSPYWEEILKLTEPDQWSSATMFQATRLFASNLKDRMAQRFYNLFLLPRLRDDIAESKTLNCHLYQALKKALFKPAAFFKGIIIPLVKSRNCTLREAVIFSSVLAKCSVPVLHSSAALLTLSEMEYTGVNSIFMRTLLEKKYTLPYRVINALVDHFLKFMDEKKELPLLWHHCLLTFVKIYRIDISQEQKDKLMQLVSVHKHEHVTPEIQKELTNKVELGEVMQLLWKM